MTKKLNKILPGPMHSIDILLLNPKSQRSYREDFYRIEQRGKALTPGTIQHIISIN